MPAATVDLAFSFVELPLTATLYQYCMVQAHFTNCAGCKSAVKNAFVRLVLQENGYFIQAKPLTIQISRTVTHPNKRPTRGQRKSYERP